MQGPVYRTATRLSCRRTDRTGVGESSLPQQFEVMADAQAVVA